MASDKENVLNTHKHVLLYKEEEGKEYSTEIQCILDNFCGVVVTNFNECIETVITDESVVYLCGDVNYLSGLMEVRKHSIKIIRDLSCDVDEELLRTRLTGRYEFISSGQVPISVHGLGVHFREFFDPYTDYFNLIKSEHTFQELKLGNFETNAFRKGLYLSHVTKTDAGEEFNLLRCSSNLGGPTDNFRETDKLIIDAVSESAKLFFEESVELNHVLAQIYINSINSENKSKKAEIKAHSDKTGKDMPKNGLIVFCSFYDEYSDFEDSTLRVGFDCQRGGISVLPRLVFKLKKCVDDSTLPKEFIIPLYPNSVFIIPLSTNRLYTHELRASALESDKIPTRMGYVIRCSKTKAIYSENAELGEGTYICSGDSLTKLVEPTKEDVSKLKELYFLENTTADVIDYGVLDGNGNIHFSMNDGDYMRPLP